MMLREVAFTKKQLCLFYKGNRVLSFLFAQDNIAVNKRICTGKKTAEQQSGCKSYENKNLHAANLTNVAEQEW